MMKYTHLTQMLRGKKGPYLIVNVFSTKVLIEDTIFPLETRPPFYVVTWSSEPIEGLPVCRAKAYLHFLVIFYRCKTLSTYPVPGIKPASSHYAVKRSTD